MDASKLEGPELDAAVALALGWKKWNAYPDCWLTGDEESPSYQHFHPSEDWRCAGPIIERERIRIEFRDGDGYFDGEPVSGPRWLAGHPGRGMNEIGPTPLIAAMRAFVASREK